MLVALAATSAHAQSPIYGLDVRNGNFFDTDTANFVTNFNIRGVNQDPIFAMDFDETGTTLWGIKSDTFEYGTFTLGTGLFTPIGTINAPMTAVTGLTCAIDGTWYLMEYDGTLGRSFLWEGDVTTGTFSQVGFSGQGIHIDISISSTNQLYAHNISDDSLYSINTSTGQGTILGPTGQAANFAQGMDFDWTDNTLYAGIYTGGGTGVFCSMNLTTGNATILEDTTSLNGEFEFAIPGSTPAVGMPFCFGDGSGTACPCGNESASGAGQGCANSTGMGAMLSAVGSNSAGSDDLVFDCATMQPGQPALLFAGLNAVSGGMGAAFGDGLRCAGGSVVRLGVKIPNAQGDASWGPGLGATGGWGAGDTRRFQSWYRNPTGSPCGFNFNLSNGFEVTFVP
jgi:hypothetical protein